MDSFFDFIYYLEYVELEIGDVENYKVPIPRRYRCNFDDSFEMYSDSQFFYTLFKNLLGLVNLNYRDNRRLPIPIVLQLLITLCFYATSNFLVGS